MALEDPRSKDTRGQRTSEGRTGPGGGGHGGRTGDGSDINARNFTPGSTVGAMGTNNKGTAAKATSTINGQIDGPPTPGGGVPGAPRETLSIENAKKVGAAYRDYVGMGDNVFEKFGNLIAKAFGFSEINPTDPTAPNPTGANAPSVTGKAAWGLDPIALALSVGGLVNPFIGLASLAYKGLTFAGLQGPQIALDSGTGRPSSVTDALTSGDRPGSAIVGLDKGNGRPMAPTAPRGTTAASTAAISPPSSTPITEETLMSLTGRNRTNQPLADPAAPVL